MVLDTSVILAIFLNEAGADEFIRAISADPVRLLSAVNALESALLIDSRKHELGRRKLDRFLRKAKIDIVPFTEDHREEAMAALRKYGERIRPANLNFCDCCAYALSKVSGEALLFKGNDFARTDVVSALKDAL
jgi:ribonuclease VapC